MDWFHGKCVGITKKIAVEMEAAKNEWMCPQCKKSACETEQKLTVEDEPKQEEQKKPAKKKAAKKKTPLRKQTSKDSTDSGSSEKKVSLLFYWT